MTEKCWNEDGAYEYNDDYSPMLGTWLDCVERVACDEWSLDLDALTEYAMYEQREAV